MTLCSLAGGRHDVELVWAEVASAPGFFAKRSCLEVPVVH